MVDLLISACVRVKCMLLEESGDLGMQLHEG